MNGQIVDAFMSGAIAMGFAATALSFFSFWKRTRIVLLGLFGLAFTLLAVERLVLVFVDGQNEFRPFVYVIRLAAFLVIIAGIALQNRSSG